MKNKCLSLIISIFIITLLCSCNSSQSNRQNSTAQVTPTTTQEPTLSQEQLNEKKLDNTIKTMTLAEKVGQMFYVRCPDVDAVQTIKDYHLGGYILFARDFEDKTKSEIIKNIQSYQDASSIPMLIGVDEEGGTVVRVSSNPSLRDTPFLSPSDTYAQGGWKAIENDAQEKSDLLLSLGINVNMAPVCDMTSEADKFMYYRSFSSNLENENRFVKTVVEISKKNKLGTVLKHFPGYGNNSDTHTGIVYDEREYSEFESNDFKPFETGINNGADCILVAHNVVNCIDSEYPASLSEKVHSILRDKLGFEGVIMTDDLVMEAITDYTGSESAAVFAVKNGNDLLCCSDVQTQYPAVLKAVQSGEISEEKINASVKRILKWKQNLGLIE